MTIRQVAALPYRTAGGALDAPVTILLVTSLETRRWVLPKGNMVTGLSDHASAAHEAEEEAGVLGAACPTSIGRYRYRKKRRNGASLMVDVAVFPIAVTDELDEWKEQEWRERRWFSPSAAADAVDEPDLKLLIRNFRPADIERELPSSGSLGEAWRPKNGFRIFRWFQAFLPRQDSFIALFEAHAVTLNAGSDALVRLLQGGAGMADHIREITERETEADDIIREVLHSVRRTVLLPFQRSAIIRLIGSMDDAIDAMYQTASTIDLYEVNDFDQEMKDMAAIIVDAARVTAEALPLLRDISGNAPRLHELTERLVRMEGQADRIHESGLKALFKTHGESNPLRFLVSREIYGHLERVVDHFEDIADEIEGLVIDNA